MVKEVASKTSDVAGDGTTTATVLARQIFTEGLAGCRGPYPMLLKRGIDKAVEAIVASLRPLQTHQGPQGNRPGRHDRRQRRFTIGDLIAEAMNKVGKEASSRSKKPRSRDNPRSSRRHAVRPRLSFTLLRYRSGKNGVRSRRRVPPDQREKDQRLKEILPFLEQIAKSTSLSSSSRKISKAKRWRLSSLTRFGARLSRRRQGPGFGDRRKAMLEDIAILTGGKLIAEELGIKLDNIGLAGPWPR